MPPKSNQPIKPLCSSTSSYRVCCNTTANLQLKVPQQGFTNLNSRSYVKMLFHSCGHARQGMNQHQCISIFPMQANISGVICRVVTLNDKGRYSSLSTKQ